MIVVSIILLLLFAAAQGAVIFGTAYVALRVLKTSNWFAKLAAMVVSYVGWVLLTITGYSLLGGDGGFMDGFGMVLTLCFTALISSFVYLLVWSFKGATDVVGANG